MEQCLYKYIGEQSPEVFIKIITSILKDKTLKVTNPKDFNDPFDCNIPHIEEGLDNLLLNLIKKEFKGKQYKKELKTKEFKVHIEELREEVVKATNELHDLWDDSISKFKVISFSSKDDNILMWSHYANYHQGLVLGFKKLEKTFFKDAKRVNYNYQQESKRFIFNYIVKKAITIKNNQDMMDEESEKIIPYLFNYFYIKKEDWKYENEWRIVFQVDDVRISQYQENIEIVNFEQETLSEIIFGYKMDNKQKKEIIKIVKNCNYNSELSIYEMIKKNGKLKREHYNFNVL